MERRCDRPIPTFPVVLFPRCFCRADGSWRCLIVPFPLFAFSRRRSPGAGAAALRGALLISSPRRQSPSLPAQAPPSASARAVAAAATSRPDWAGARTLRCVPAAAATSTGASAGPPTEMWVIMCLPVFVVLICSTVVVPLSFGSLLCFLSGCCQWAPVVAVLSAPATDLPAKVRIKIGPLRAALIFCSCFFLLLRLDGVQVRTWRTLLRFFFFFWREGSGRVPAFDDGLAVYAFRCCVFSAESSWRLRADDRTPPTT